MINMLSSPHIPAWKKLGLKLKNGQDLSEASNGGDIYHQASKKNSIEGRVDSKKGLEKGKPPRSQVPRVTNVSLSNSTSKSLHSKTVSFSAGTKGADRTPSQQLHQEQASQTSGSWSITLDEVISSVSQSSTSEISKRPKELKEPKKPKKPKKPKEPKTSNQVKNSKSPRDLSAKSSLITTSHSASTGQGDPTEESPPLPSPALQYLQTYHTDRPSWKFNKARQTYILKNMYNQEKIPHEYDDALRSYLGGLSGNNVCARVREEASKILVEVDEKINAAKAEVMKKEEAKLISGEDAGDRKDFAESTSNSDFATQDIPQISAQESPNNDPPAQQSSAKTTLKSSLKATAAEVPTEASNSTKRSSESSLESSTPESKRQKLELDSRKHALAEYKKPFRQREALFEEHILQQDDRWRRQLFTRRRADILLWAVPEVTIFERTESEPMAPDISVQSELRNEIRARVPGHVHYEIESHPKAGGAPGAAGAVATKAGPGQQKRRRKRKRRTGVPDDDSSEDESSSDSSVGCFVRGEVELWKGKGKQQQQQEQQEEEASDVAGVKMVSRGAETMAVEEENEKDEDDEDDEEEEEEESSSSEESSEESSDAESSEDDGDNDDEWS